MGLAPGTRLGHYDVTSLLGEGGMGQVWQARDTQLNRQVALKILPDAFAADPDRLARFKREAQILASLNHPNIAAIYGIEEAEGTRALVLELVEGQTLADRISKGPIPLDEALPIAKQTAEALEAAHEAGVIHRDLKPANIKVREDGTVKVLDFGLAKAFQPDVGDPSVSASPTISLTAMATQMGMIIGTAAYMSPEQARGKTVDKRTDIWAFGVVLYEMLTGARPFQGEDVSLTLASVMKSDLNVTRLPDDVPATVWTVVRRCLDKDPSQRIRDIGDVRLAMEGAFESAAGPAPAAFADAASRSGWRRSLPWVAGLVVAALTGSGVWLVTRPAAPAPTAFGVTLPSTVAPTIGGMALSPDGRTLVFSASDEGQESGLYLRRLDALEPTFILGTEGAIGPFFSPDGAWVGFFEGGDLRKVPLDGRPPVTLCALPGSANRRGASWGANNTVVFSVGGSLGLWQVSANGGEPEPIAAPDAEDALGLDWIDVLPDGDAALGTLFSGVDSSQIAAVDLDSGQRRILTAGTFPRYSATGHIVYWREESLWAVPFDADRRVLTGSPVPVVRNVQVNTGGLAHFALSRTGTLAYMASRDGPAIGTVDMLWVDRDGRETPIPTPPRHYIQPRISPDGSQVVAAALDEEADLWLYDTRGPTRRLTFGAEIDWHPVWMPDGSRIAFFSHRDPPGVYWRAADGTGETELLVEGYCQPTGVTLDSAQLLLAGDGGITLLSLDGSADLREIIGSESSVSTAAVVSAVGQWLAYVSNESGENQIYVRPFPDVESGLWQLSNDRGWGPRWAPDGSALYFRNGLSLMQVAVTAGLPSAWGAASPLFEDPYFLIEVYGVLYDIAPDGQRFVMERVRTQGDAAQSQLTVVEHWAGELSRLAPVD